MKSNFPKIAFLISIITFLVFSLGFIYFFRAINKNNLKSEEIEKEWQTEFLRREEIRNLDRSIKDIQDEKTELETHFAKSSDIVPFLNTIQALATDSNNKADIVSVSIADDKSGLIVDIKSVGTFSNVYKFLTLLENSPYELDFDSMQVRAESTGVVDPKVKKDPVWDAEFRIKLLSFTQ